MIGVSKSGSPELKLITFSPSKTSLLLFENILTVREGLNLDNLFEIKAIKCENKFLKLQKNYYI